MEKDIKRYKGNKYIKTSLETRFWSKVSKSKPNECWEWQAGLSDKGYGRIYNKELTSQDAHRVSWHLSNGKIPKGLFVLHKCDNRKCVNPNHLYLGTHQDNMIDREKRNRNGMLGVCGSKHHNSKLTEEVVLIIRALAKRKDLTRKDLAGEFNISLSSLEKIIYREQWKHI